MANKHRDYEDDYPDDGYVDQQRQSQGAYYGSDAGYDDETPMRVEENPYFNRNEIEASAAF